MENSNATEISVGTSKAIGPPLAPRVWRILTLGGRLSRRIALLVWAAAVIGLGLVFSWSWLVAAGLSSVVLGLLPCAAMCAAGLCASGSGKKCSENSDTNGAP